MTWNRAARAMFALAALSLSAGYASGMLRSKPERGVLAQQSCGETFSIQPSCIEGTLCPGTFFSPTALPPIDFTRTLPRPGSGCTASLWRITVQREAIGVLCPDRCRVLTENGLYKRVGTGWDLVDPADPTKNPQIFDQLPGGNEYRYYEQSGNGQSANSVTVTIIPLN